MAQMNGRAITAMNEDERNDEDNSSLEEWTLLDKVSNDSIKRIACTKRKNEIGLKKYTDAEVAREAIQVLEPSSSSLEHSEENSGDKNRTECSHEKDEGSDGASVISENVNKMDESRICNISNVTQSVDKAVTPTGAFTYIVVACSLAAVIGFGIGCMIGKRETRVSGNEVNFGYTESMECIQHSEELNKKIVGPDVNVKTAAVWEEPEDTSESISHNEQSMNIENNYKSKNGDSLRVILEKVKFSLDILCSVIDDGHESREANEYISVCAEPFSIMNLIELKDNMQSVMTDIGYIEDRSNKWFMDNMESKLKNISVSLINDLSATINKSVTKIHRKFDKIRQKLDQRLCLIRNTIGDDERIKKILSKYNVLEENCATQKFVHQEKIVSDMTHNLENIQKNIGKHIYVHPVGPEAKIESNKENSNVRVEDKDYRKKEKVPKYEREKPYKSKKDYKSRKNFSKGDFTSERETMELQKDKTKKIQRPTVITPNIVEGPCDKSDTEQFCHTNSYSKQRINDRKNGRDVKHENWQFKRSEGRVNWREEKKVTNDDDESSWDDKRAKARRSAREKY